MSLKLKSAVLLFATTSILTQQQPEIETMLPSPAHSSKLSFRVNWCFYPPTIQTSPPLHWIGKGVGWMGEKIWNKSTILAFFSLKLPLVMVSWPRLKHLWCLGSGRGPCGTALLLEATLTVPAAPALQQVTSPCGTWAPSLSSSPRSQKSDGSIACITGEYLPATMKINSTETIQV